MNNTYKLLLLPKADRNRAIEVSRRMMRLGIDSDKALTLIVDAVYERWMSRRDAEQRRVRAFDETSHYRSA